MHVRETPLPRRVCRDGPSLSCSGEYLFFWDSACTHGDTWKCFCDGQVRIRNWAGHACRSIDLGLPGSLWFAGAGDRCWCCLLNCTFLVTCFLPTRSIYGSNGKWVTAVWAVCVELKSLSECECRSDKSSPCCCWGEYLMMTAVVVQIPRTINVFASAMKL